MKKKCLFQFLVLLLLTPLFADQFQPFECLKQDLPFVHSIIKEDFSGYADSEKIRQDIQATFAELQSSMKTCSSKLDYVKAIKRYFSSLHDPHIQPLWNFSEKYRSAYDGSTGKSYSKARFDLIEYTSVGIILKKLNNQFFVDNIDSRLLGDKVPLKPGDELISCDGKKALDILHEEILPFESVTAIEAAQYKHAAKIFFRWDKLPGSISACEFKQDDKLVTYKLEWKSVKSTYIDEVSKTTREPVYQVIDKPYGKWLKVKSFAGYDDETVQQLKKCVTDAEKLRAEKVLVLDLRGNGGGNSSWGTQWIEALYGDTIDIPTPSDKILASPRNLAHYERFFASLMANGSLNENDRKDWQRLIDSLKSNPGQLISLSDSGPESVPEVRTVKENFQFKGKLYVVIDWGNFSAAEFFIQELKVMPNVELLGLPTDASTSYGDIRFETTPSGLIFKVPTKVFFTSFHDRKSGEPISPHVRLEYDVKAELSGKDSIMQQVDLHIQNQGTKP